MISKAVSELKSLSRINPAAIAGSVNTKLVICTFSLRSANLLLFCELLGQLIDF